MKLIFCPKCQDVVKLQTIERRCNCGLSWGWYSEDGLLAYIGGEATPLGIANSSFLYALRTRPSRGEGKVFTAFVIPRECSTVIKVNTE